MLTVCTVFGGASGVVVGYGLLACLRASLTWAKDFPEVAHLEGLYHATKVQLHYPSLYDAALCAYGDEKHCKELTVEDTVYLTSMLIIAIYMARAFKHVFLYLAEVSLVSII